MSGTAEPPGPDARTSWAQINDLFAELVDLPGEEQAERLAAWRGDDAVRREVESLLGALSSGLRLEPSPGASHLTLAGETAAFTISLTGRRLGPWSVVREVGRGGMGAVYEAFRADDLYQKRVAVKTLTRGADSEVIARRFQQERQILASLEHPNIAMLIDGGVTEEQLPYLVMEFVDGVPIDRYCESHRLTLAQRLDLFRQVCSAVQYAHRNLVVHRDLKPSNVLITADGNVKLVDFGIAKLLGAVPGDATPTETGLRAFTTAYASPEQVRGEPISTSTDVYSLGAMLYQLVAGRLPFEVSNLTPAEALRRIAEAPPPPPSRVCTGEAARAMGLESRERLTRELRGELDDVVLAALRKEPERRYATVNALSEDLKRFLQGQQISARPDTWRYRVRAFSRRNPGLVTMAAIAALALVAGSAAALWQARRAGVERDRAQEEAARSARVIGFIEQTLAAPAQGALTDPTIQLLDYALTRATAELGDDPRARAAVYRTAANAFVTHNRDAKALPLVDSALILDRLFAGDQSPEVARDLTIAARLAYNRGLLDSAVHHAGEAVRILKSRPPERGSDLGTALLYHSFALTYAGRPAEAEPVAREGIALESRRQPGPLLPYLYMALGEARVFQGDWPGGEAQYRASASLYDTLGIPEPAERGIAELGLASALLNRGALEEAAQRSEKGLEVLLRHWGPDHAYTARIHGIRARIALRRGDRPAAAREAQAIAGALERGRTSLIDRAALEMELGRYHLAVGQPAEAVRRLERFLADAQDELADAPQILGAVQAVQGPALLAVGRGQAAVQLLSSAWRSQRETYGDTNSVTRYTARLLVAAAARVGNLALLGEAAASLPPDTIQAIRRRALAQTNPRKP